MKTEIKVQNENINELIRLAKENPTLQIVPMVDSELCGDEYSSYLGQWGKPSIDERYGENGIIYFRSDDESLVDNLMCKDETLDELNAQAIVDGYEWEKVIVVRIGTL